MDINIKYKQQEETTIIDELLEAYKGGYNKPTKELLVKTIDRVYKEDSKQIESVEIKHFVVDEEYQLIDKELRHGFKWGNEGSMEYITKSELSQYINLLQQIEKQME